VTTPETALLAATAAHFGFQVTVTTLVYPALARVPADRWVIAHDAHSRAIVPLVALVYGALALTGGWALLSGPSGWTLPACAALAATGVATVFAARVHGRLGAGHDREQIGLLLRIDRVRAVTATLALVAAALATR
jgi:hypothetical protein